MRRTICLIAFIFAIWAFWEPVFAQNPGTQGDPLVSKSYLDRFFRFRPVVIPASEKLTVSSGALLVLRSGRLKLRCAPGKGLVDLTDGKEILSGMYLPGSHLMLVADAASYTLEAQSLSYLMTMGLMPDHLKKK